MSRAARRIRIAAMFLAFALGISLAACRTNAAPKQIKEPAVAGAFYPAEPDKLGALVKGFLANAAPAKDASLPTGRLVALVSPHAGYVYSGQVAAYGYARLPRKYDTVVIIGSSHYASYTGASVYAEGAFRTPLGLVDIDEKRAAMLLDTESHIAFDPKRYEKEHCIEVQIPFLQSVLGNDFKIIPILIGSPTRATYDRLVDKLSEIASDEGVLMVASTDLSHYHDYETALGKDARTVDAIRRISTGEAGRLLQSGEAEMCGAYAVMVALDVARRAGADRTELFKYANSGDVTGDKGRVVGYSSIGIYADPLTGGDRAQILAMARKGVQERVLRGRTLDSADGLSPRLMTDGAAFVTINRMGMLRGCIGHVLPIEPLYKSILHNAAAASSLDPRFPPMKADELGDMEIEVSILSQLRPTRPEDVLVGRDGLYIEKHGRSGILLPQVPVELGWDRQTYLKQICRKAGLPEDAYRDARLMSFTAEVIREKDSH